MKVVMTTGDRRPLTESERAQLKASDNVVPNTGDIPEAPAENWRDVRRFVKPRKEAISLRVDVDVLDWLRQNSERYQSEINRILRERMLADQSR